MAEIGSVGQALVAGHAHVLLHPPQQICAGGLRLPPQDKAEEISIGQALHALAQVRGHSLSQGDFAGSVAVHLTAE